MQSSPSAPSTGDLVLIRRQRWRVVDSHVDGAFRLLTVAGAGVSNATYLRQFVTPFDVACRLERSILPKRATAREWRRALRQLIAASAPPGALRALPAAAIDLLPHQLEPALAIVRGMCTRVLLADGVGLGKTIEAGLILAELRARGAVLRALLLTPAGLRDQWRDELLRRFGICAKIADASGLRASAAMFSGHVNPWQIYDVAIASTDLVKRPEHLASVLRCSWDLLIVDEAHNAATDTERHAAVDALAKRTPYVILLTATPHSGDQTSFSALRDLGAHGETIAVFRRTRRDVNLASARRAVRLQVTPTAAERRMHDALSALTRAVTREHGEASAPVWLALAVLNKRALSSAWALQCTVAKRLRSLSIEAEVQCTLPFADPDGELDPSDDAPEWTGGPALADVRQERRLLEAVARAASEAMRAGESKIDAIRRYLRRVRERTIVFSEYRDTLRHLAARLPVATLQLHGGLTAAERAAVLHAFTAPTFSGALLATDAAGEGLNLHERCRLVINLELPWNPIRLEQRIGRVDRIGQRQTVHALVLVARRTPEVRLLERLRDRIARAQREVGAADPLHLLTERDVERLVLGAGDQRAGSQPPPSTLWTPALRAEADAEVERARLVRRVLSRSVSAIAAVDRPLIATSRHHATRARLGDAGLVIVEAVLEDAIGRIVERTLLPFHAAECSSSGAGTFATGPLPPYACEVVRTWATTAEAAWRSFVDARLHRERQILLAIGATAPAVDVQRGLFDRRTERVRATARGAHAAVVDALSRRCEATAVAAGEITHRVAVRLVITSRR